MNADERPHSLADQAAAWVPPWERAPAPRDAGVPDPVTVEPGSVSYTHLTLPTIYSV